MYLWFYEWNMFEALLPGEHTNGVADWPWQVSNDKSSAVMKSSALSLAVDATNDGADILLTITNKSGHDWPETAAIIPCFNPGSKSRLVPGLAISPQFLDQPHKSTYFLGRNGLDLLYQREIHFNEALRPVLDTISPDGKFVFSHKWPTSQRDAVAGLLIRESRDREWVTAIAWEDFLSAQGHNPWKCMHLAVRVGPLKQGNSKKIRGKIYLFRGTKEDCLERFRNDFLCEK